MPRLVRSLFIIFSVMLFAINSFSIAQEEITHQKVDSIVNGNVEPEGVVFEVIEWQDNTWQWASPMIQSLIIKLNIKYPDLEFAIVSHGDEQFELIKSRKKDQPIAMNILHNLNKDGVSLHVCGVNSSWNNTDYDEYIDIVDVAVSGPAKINDYIMLGFEHIIISK